MWWFKSDEPNKAELVNNYDWMKNFSFLDFIRDIGKHITVNYMMSKESVKKRLGEESKQGMSFTEFTYQLVQGYDFLYLNEHKDCKLQMGGSDQWGNITTGTELIRRKTNNDSFALTIPLITKSDGGKFGKTEGGNVWLDPEKTSPYEFYQFWMRVSDEDAEKYIKVFTMLGQEEIEKLISEHSKQPHVRLLQSRLAEEITCMVHSRKDYEDALNASQILFGKGTKESLEKLDRNTFFSIFDGVQQYKLDATVLDSGVGIFELLTEYTTVFASKGELRRMLKGGGLSLNKEKVSNPELQVGKKDLLNESYILIQKGKKNYYVIHT